ncbi:MAG TPA: hypothetical protein PK095_22365 [Myxococcota bacterium]|nr:hypothetical protein [Myxococcota bacterium]
MKSILAALSISLFIPSVASAKDPLPRPGAPEKASQAFESTLISGLKLIRDNKWDDWMNTHCSSSKLCLNANSKKSLKTYNLPAMQRRIQRGCLKSGDTIKVIRTEGNPNADTTIKVFIECETTAMPVPFHLIKEGDKWLFSKI